CHMANIEVEAALRARLAGRELDSGRKVELMTVEVGVEFIDEQLRSLPLPRHRQPVHHHVSQRDAFDPALPVNVKGLERPPPDPRTVSLRRRIRCLTRRMAVEREMFRSTPAGLRSFHGPLPISPQWKR